MISLMFGLLLLFIMYFGFKLMFDNWGWWK